MSGPLQFAKNRLVWFSRRVWTRLVAPIPYTVGIRLIEPVLSSSRLQSTLFAGRCRHLQHIDQLGQLGGQTGAETIDIRLACAQQLFAAFGGNWRLFDLLRRPAVTATPWLEVQGLAHVETAVSRGGVVLLSSHFGAARLIPLVVAQKGHRVLSLESADRYADMGLAQVTTLEVEPLSWHRQAFPPRAAVAAQRRLRAGGVVHLAGDGYIGRARDAMPFCGRSILVRSSFALMAIESGASVIVSFATVDDRGRVLLEFLPPLDAGDSADTPAARADRLVRGYWRELERRWRKDPGNVSKKHFKSVLKLPRLDRAELASEAGRDGD